jgi:hypothetical protein
VHDIEDDRDLGAEPPGGALDALDLIALAVDQYDPASVVRWVAARRRGRAALRR